MHDRMGEALNQVALYLSNLQNQSNKSLTTNRIVHSTSVTEIYTSIFICNCGKCDVLCAAFYDEAGIMDAEHNNDESVNFCFALKDESLN
mmetsp:Transcript_28331/g.32589  ORF Transcript_28331/g.32589 Transcript_28331/m.32589 type:complete len:90 (+) Transcript_28331:1640-1909(+)